MSDTRSLSITIHQARELYGTSDAMDTLLLANFTKEELNGGNLPKWENLPYITGWYIDKGSCIGRTAARCPLTEGNRNIFPRRNQARAILAMAQLAQLMEVANDGWFPDWEDNSDKYCIEYFNRSIYKSLYESSSQFLAFKTKEIRNEFIEAYKDLIEEYFLLFQA